MPFPLHQKISHNVIIKKLISRTIKTHFIDIRSIAIVYRFAFSIQNELKHNKITDQS